VIKNGKIPKLERPEANSVHLISFVQAMRSFFQSFARFVIDKKDSHTDFRTMQNTGQYAVGWFTLSLINAGLAQSKGRSGLGWWLGSLLLGPVATLLIVILEPPPPKSGSPKYPLNP